MGGCRVSGPPFFRTGFLTIFLVRGVVGQHFSWTSVIWLPFASGKLRVEANWPKMLLLASTAWTEGGEGEEASKSVFPSRCGL